MTKDNAPQFTEIGGYGADIWGKRSKKSTDNLLSPGHPSVGSKTERHRLRLQLASWFLNGSEMGCTPFGSFRLAIPTTN